MAKSTDKIKTLDLHGYKVSDVPDAVDRFLVQANSQNHSRIRILTGKGTGAVKSAVIEYLKLGKYDWEYERLPNGRNEGSLIVFVS